MRLTQSLNHTNRLCKVCVLLFMLLLILVGMFEVFRFFQVKEVTIPKTEVQHIKSHVNNVAYKLFIGFPDGYNTDVSENIRFCTFLMVSSLSQLLMR